MPDRDFDPASGQMSQARRLNADRTEQAETLATPGVERSVVDHVACRAGDDSCATAHASTLNRATASHPARAERSLLQLQRQYGNRYVERVLARAKEDANHDSVSPSVERAIQQERSGGQGLDSGVRRQMEGALGANFSGVRVHADAQADSLSRSLSARAFTTGQDIFFRQGAYQPGTSVGRELIAHELTHVVQQGGDQVRRAMSVSQPSDPHEVEAEHTARAVIQQEHTGHEAHGDKEKDEEHSTMINRCACEGAQRQPEAIKGKDEEEERKKHHVSRALDGSSLSRLDEPEQAG
jgi:uncharacterized protein DUF4157